MILGINNISRILTIGDDISIVIAAVYGIRIWKNSTIFWRITILNVFLATITEVIGYIYKQKHSNDVIPFNIYILIAMWLLVSAALLLINKKTASIITLIFSLINTYVWFYFINNNGINVFANWALVCSSVLIAAIYFITFIQLFSNNTLQISKQPVFWLCVAIIIYYCANIPIFSMLNYLNEKNLALATKLYLINIVLGMVYYSLMSYSFYVYHKSAKAIKITSNGG